MERLEAGQSRRSLLLTPTGRIRADFHVARIDDDTFLLLQAAEQPEAVDAILAPYVLSSDVELDEPERAIGRSSPSSAAWPPRTATHGLVLAPSVLGIGHDIVVPSGEPARADSADA